MISHKVLESFLFSAIELHSRSVLVKDIADSFGVTQQAVYRWTARAKKKGKESLKALKLPDPDLYLSNNQLTALLPFLRQPASKFSYLTNL